METQSPPPFDLPTQAWRYLVHTLYTLLPPPGIDTPQALEVRNQAAIARIADLGPVNAAEAELATQCVVARAQAEDVMRLIRRQDGNDSKHLLQLNNQYSRMVRTSLDAHGHLLRAQQLRRKLEATGGDQDAWTRHIAARHMQTAAPIEPQPPAAPLIAQEVSEPGNQSHHTGSETPARQPYLHIVESPAATRRTSQEASPSPEMPPIAAPTEDNPTIRPRPLLDVACQYADLPPTTQPRAIPNNHASPMPPAKDPDLQARRQA